MKTKNLNLPDYLTKKQKSDIKRAIKDNIPIIVKGKTALVNLLKEQGIVAFELWECQEIELNELLRKWGKYYGKSGRIVFNIFSNIYGKSGFGTSRLLYSCERSAKVFKKGFVIIGSPNSFAIDCASSSTEYPIVKKTVS